MKSGLTVGQKAAFTVDVTEEMIARFDGEVVHPVYSTFWMVHHMEYAARQVILPFLEADEEGMGVKVEAEHIAPTPVGMPVTVTATLTALRGNRIVCDVVVDNKLGTVGRGSVVQAVLPKRQIRARIAALEEAVAQGYGAPPDKTVRIEASARREETGHQKPTNAYGHRDER